MLNFASLAKCVEELTTALGGQQGKDDVNINILKKSEKASGARASAAISGRAAQEAANDERNDARSSSDSDGKSSAHDADEEGQSDDDPEAERSQAILVSHAPETKDGRHIRWQRNIQAPLFPSWTQLHF